jgi:hypothetical protein
VALAVTSIAALAAVPLTPPAAAYAPGSGELFSENFDGQLDPDWEQSNGLGGNPSPWTQVVDGADKSFYADGMDRFLISSTRHWARHYVHPVSATTFSIAFEYRSELGTGYRFFLDVEQRAEILRKYRLRIDGNGALSLWRTVSGSMTQVSSTAAGTVPVNTRRWVRLAIEPDPTGHPRIRVRLWSGGATAEPATWTVDFLDDLDTLVRAHRFELDADGPKGVETWIDDLDAWGDRGRGVVSSVTDIYVVELSHLDIGFTEPPDEIELFAKTHLDQVLDNLAAAPDYRWLIESGWFLEQWWNRSTDEERQEMLAQLVSGRLSLGAGYANMHTTTLGHEQFIRNIYYSTRLARGNGFSTRTWVTDDVPGSSFAVPEVLARAGIEFFVGGMNTVFGGRVLRPDHGDRPFWWVGPDGSRVLAWITFDSYAEGFDYGFSFFDDLAALYQKLGKKLPEQEEAGYGFPELMLLRGFDNHYQGFHVRDLVNQWNAAYDTPVFHLATPEEFLDLMLARYGAEAFPSHSGDFGAAWAGSRSGAPHTEAMLRQAHREARAAEALLAAGSAMDAQPVPRDDVDFAYRKMLATDEHSGAGGWPGYFTPEEMDRNNRIHLGYATDARDKARDLVEDGLDRMLGETPSSGDAVVAVNPLGRSRDGWVRVALPAALYGTSFRVIERSSGTEVPYQRFDPSFEILFRASGLPPFGYRAYDLVPGTPAATPAGMLSVTTSVLENDAYRLAVDPADGSISSLIDKSTGHELVDTASTYDFNELASNTKSEYDFQAAPRAEPPASVTASIESDGPLLGAIKVARTGTPHIETTYRLYRGEDRVEIENVLDRDRMPYVPNSISVRAYMVTMPFDIHNFQIRTETTTRFLDPVGDSFQRDSVFDWHNAEHSLAFWDGDGGMLYAADSVTAHHFENLSSLTSSSYSTANALLLPRLADRSDEYQFEDGSIGPYEMEPDTSPIYRFTHHLRATAPGFDPVEASAFGFESLSPPLARLVGRRPGNLPGGSASLFSVDAAGVLPYTLKPPELGSGVVLRLCEMTGTTATARVSSDVVTLSDPELVEHDEEGGTPLPMDGNGFLVPLDPYATLTVRVQAAPAWSPILLRVGKQPPTGEVTLSWSGGVSPFTLERAEDVGFVTGTATLVDEQPVTSHDDPVLEDGKTYFYRVR